MAILSKSVLVLIAFCLSGCNHLTPSLISLDHSPVNDLSALARVVEDSDHPLLLRGLDGILLKSRQVPNISNQYTYLMKAGQHLFWVMNLPYGHPLIPQKMRCYVIEAELAQGALYRLKEDIDMKRALLVRNDTGEKVAIGRVVDEPWVFLRSCRWQ